jgi:nitrite reductase/ring-hydroxylating ferredoxin subunit
MDNWAAAVSLAAVPEGTAQKVNMPNMSLLVINAGGHIYALKNQCPHLGCAMHKGELDGLFIKCPCHDWVFDIRSGEFTAAPEITIPTYPVKVENGEIFINLGGETR